MLVQISFQIIVEKMFKFMSSGYIATTTTVCPQPGLYFMKVKNIFKSWTSDNYLPLSHLICLIGHSNL